MRRVHVLVGCMVLCTACTKASDDADDMLAVDNLTVDNLVVDGSLDPIIDGIIAERNPHNYAEEEDGVYSYVAGVSEEKRKRGKAAGDVLLFAYRGIVNGKYVLSSVNDEGRTTYKHECSKPCRVIKSYYGKSLSRMAYTPSSVIGGAFEDALNGRLKVKLEPRPSQQDSTSDTEIDNSPAASLPLTLTETVDPEGDSEEAPSNNLVVSN